MSETEIPMEVRGLDFLIQRFEEAVAQKPQSQTLRSGLRSLKKMRKKREAEGGAGGEAETVPEPGHVCGLQGFGRGQPGEYDVCPACERAWAAR